MGDWDKQELVEKIDDLLDLAKHLLGIDHSSTTSKSGKGSKASGKSSGSKIIFVGSLIPACTF